MRGMNPQSLAVRVASILLFAMVVMFAGSAQAQTFSVLHQFSGGDDGGEPWAGVTVDAGGNLYGTATSGGYTGGNCSTYHGCGIVFRLKSGGSGTAIANDLQGSINVLNRKR